MNLPDAHLLRAEPGDVLVAKMPYPLDNNLRIQATAEIKRAFELSGAAYIPPIIFLDERLHLGLYQEKPAA